MARAALLPDADGLHAVGAAGPGLGGVGAGPGRGQPANVVVVDGQFGGETAFSGFGAGGEPTAVAVVSDLTAIARGNAAPPDGWLPASEEPSPVAREFEGSPLRAVS